MAKLKANRRPVRRQAKTVVLTGTCSNCREKNTEVVKIKGSQVCTAKCLGGVTYPEPQVSVPGIPQAIIDGVLGTQV